MGSPITDLSKTRDIPSVPGIWKRESRRVVEVLGRSKSLRRVIFDGNPMGKVAEGLEKKREAHQKQLQSTKKRLDNINRAIERYSGEMGSFLDGLKSKIQDLEKQLKDLLFQIQTIDHQVPFKTDFYHSGEKK